MQYIRGAPGVVNGSGEENPPLPINQHSLLVVRHRAFHGGRQNGHRHCAAQQGSRPPPPHGQTPRSKKVVKEEDHSTHWVCECVRLCGLHTLVFPSSTTSFSSLRPPPCFCCCLSWILGFFERVLGRSDSGSSSLLGSSGAFGVWRAIIMPVAPPRPSCPRNKRLEERDG